MNQKIEYMKMDKQMVYLLVAGIVWVLSFTSCENEIPYNPSLHVPQLVMNALLEAGEEENFVYLSLSGANNISHVDEAVVTLYVNGRAVEVAEELPPIQPFGNAPDTELPEIAKRKKFRLKTKSSPGDCLRLEAVAEGGRYRAEASVVVPQPLDGLRVDTATVMLRYRYDSWKPCRRYLVSIDDRPGELNYYRLDIRRELKIYGRSFVGNDTVDFVKKTSLVNREDVVLTDGRPMTGDEEDNFFLPNMENKFNIFSDRLFAGSSHTLKVYTETLDDFTTSVVHDVKRVEHKAVVRLLSLNEEEYRYLKALNCLDSDDYDTSLMEPVVIPSNVKGGLGFVGCSADVRMELELPEVVFNGYM